LKKCTPRNSADRDVTAASVVIEIDDVFDAIQRAGLRQLVDVAQDRSLSRVLGRRLDDYRSPRGRRTQCCP
jgi:hypothetical protein